MRRVGATVAAVLAVASLSAACGVEAGGPAAQTTEPRESGSEDLTGAEVLAAMRDSVALIETPAGSGSSVLLADGYLLTNAHVVDPFTAVDVTFEGAETFADVPVVGVDLVADLAVVGPVETDREPPPIVDPAILEPGSDVYLVGFPGDQRQQEVTLASGVISRTRSADPWGLEYLQTDTTIGGGQSGGALVDASGHVIGISGLEDYDDFAYSLSGADVLDRLDDLLDGGDRGWEPAPRTGLETAFAAEPDEYWPTALYLPYVADDVDLSVTVPAGTAVVFADPGDPVFPWGGNQAAADRGDEGYWDSLDMEVLDSDGGTVTAEVYGGTDAVVLVSPPPGGGTVDVRSNLELIAYELANDVETISVGEARAGVLNRLDESVLYEVELEEGETVEIAARSAVGDVAWDVLPADEATEGSDDVVSADDGGGGLFDLDAVDTYTAGTGGLHYVWVYDYDDAAVAYELAITEA